MNKPKTYSLEVREKDPVGGRNVRAHHTLLPIPQSEIDLVPSLSQNPGY